MVWSTNPGRLCTSYHRTSTELPFSASKCDLALKNRMAGLPLWHGLQRLLQGVLGLIKQPGSFFKRPCRQPVKLEWFYDPLGLVPLYERAFVAFFPEPAATAAGAVGSVFRTEAVPAATGAAALFVTTEAPLALYVYAYNVLLTLTIHQCVRPPVGQACTLVTHSRGPARMVTRLVEKRATVSQYPHSLSAVDRGQYRTLCSIR